MQEHGMISFNLPMNRSAEHRLGTKQKRATNEPRRCSALRSRGSWSQCAVGTPWGLSMNRPGARAARPHESRLRPKHAGGLPALLSFPGSWSRCMRKREAAFHELPARNRPRRRPRARGIRTGSITRATTKTTNSFTVTMYARRRKGLSMINVL